MHFAYRAALIPLVLAQASATCACSGSDAKTQGLGGSATIATDGTAAAGAGGNAAGRESDRGGSRGATDNGGSITTGGGIAVAGGASGGQPESSGGNTGQSGAGVLSGAAGAVSDPRDAASVLDGFALLKPCVSGFKPSGNPNNAGDCCCEELAQNENQHVTKQFGGDLGATYRVKLRVAGIAERYWYADGQLDPTSKLFYTGGFPTIHSDRAANTNLNAGQGACKVHPPQTDGDFMLPFSVPALINPKDGCFNGFNIFAMTVSSAAGQQAYYLNYTTDFDGADRQPHSVYKNDYTVTIAIPGQAQLDFYTIDGDHHQVTNNGTMSVPNLKTPQPYNGNFLELTVLDVTIDN